MMLKHYCWVSCISLLLVFITSTTFANPVIITGKNIIDKDTVYKDVQLDLTNGYFHVVNGATLEIKNCSVKGTISTTKRNIINIASGKLLMQTNIVKINAVDIPQNKIDPSLYHVIAISEGTITLSRNKFSTDTPYTIGFLITNLPYTSYTSGFDIRDNEFKNWHGGLILSNSHNASIVKNKFINVGISNILILNSGNILIEKNTMLFSGNNSVGDAIDILDSQDININKNFIASGSCYSIIVLGGQNIVIQHNHVVSGITYAIYVVVSLSVKDLRYKNLVDQYKILSHFRERSPHHHFRRNQDIYITNNYLAQNRYGFVAEYVNNLTVTDNVFIQRFPTSNSRKFWTNNDILFNNVSDVIWDNNLYKEAYAQNFLPDNDISTKLVGFPLQGGVNL